MTSSPGSGSNERRPMRSDHSRQNPDSMVRLVKSEAAGERRR